MASEGQETTDRGFTIYDTFTDSHGTEVRIVESSSALDPAVWIFTTKGSDQEPAHLNREQAIRVRDALSRFIEETADV